MEAVVASPRGCGRLLDGPAAAAPGCRAVPRGPPAEALGREPADGGLAGTSRPTTAAGSMTARSSRPADRAARRAAPGWMGGTLRCRPPRRPTRQRPSMGRMAPSSTSIDTNCSTNSGLPSAAAVTRSRIADGGTPAAPSSASTIRAASSSGSGPQRRSDPGPAPVPHAGCSSSRSWRAVHSSRQGASTPPSVRCARSSSSVGSAQWMSSMTTTSGPRAPRMSSIRPHRPEALREREDPSSRLASALDAVGHVVVAEHLEQPSVRRPGVVVLGDVRRAANDLDQRPERDALDRTAGTGRAGPGPGADSAQELLHERDLPTPASPRTVDRCGRAHAVVSASSLRRRRQLLVPARPSGMAGRSRPCQLPARSPRAPTPRRARPCP